MTAGQRRQQLVRPDSVEGWRAPPAATRIRQLAQQSIRLPCASRCLVGDARFTARRLGRQPLHRQTLHAQHQVSEVRAARRLTDVDATEVLYDAVVERPDDLPDFDSPPVDEVVIGVQFNHSAEITLNRQVAFWQRHADEFPTFSQQQPIVTVEEDVTQPPGPTPVSAASIGRLLSGQTTRLWLEQQPGTWLIQVQPNMFVLNWRYRGEPYPRFDAVLDRFTTFYTDYRSYLSGESIDLGPVTALDLTYVNWLPEVPMQEVIPMAAETRLSGRNVHPWPAAQAHTCLYQLIEGDTSMGRLNVEIQTAKRPADDDWVNGTQYQLAARMVPEQDIDSMRQRFNFGRNAIVQAFADLVTEGARARWQER